MNAQEHPFAFLRHRADVLACCAETKNLHVTEPQKDVKLAICKVCGRKHRKLYCEPGSILARTFRAMAGKAG